MTSDEFFAAAKGLSFEDRVELAHCLWDEFMDGFREYKAPPMPEGIFPWKKLKLEADQDFHRLERLEMAQRLWTYIIEEGYDPPLSREQMEELARRAENALKHPEQWVPAEQVFAELEQRLRAKK